MSLAQALLEFLAVEKKPIVLSATHYHELTRLASVYNSIKNGSLAVEEKGNEIKFLYTLQDGPASKSYGIEVARLAGLPDSVLQRAKKLLRLYESNSEKKMQPPSQQMNFLLDSEITNLKRDDVLPS